MTRAIISAARSLISTPRRLVLPVGMKGRASLSFDGVDDYVTGVGVSPGTSPWTMLCWVKMANYPGAGIHYTLMTAGDPAAGAHMSDYTLIGGVPTWRAGSSAYDWASYADALCPAVGQWRRLGFVRRAGNAPLELWLDGGLRAVSPAVNPDVATSGARLGSAYTNTWFAKALMDDARMYSRAWSAGEFAADYRGEWVDPTGLVRRWTCENPGYGTTCYEEIGKTSDAITGALWDPRVPFRRRRKVEDVAAAMLGDGATTCTVAHHANLDPAAGSWSLGLWTSARGTSGDIIAQKDDGATGWILDFTTGGALRLRLREGATTITVTGSAMLRSLWTTPKGTHRHVEITVDRSGGYAYLAIDGGPPARTALGALGSIANAADLIFGAGASGVVGGLNDAVFHKGTAWTWDQRDALYYQGEIPSGAISWAMREGAGTTVASSPVGYDGTLSAASWTTQTRCKARPAA